MPAIGLQYRLMLSSTELTPAIGPQNLLFNLVLNETLAVHWTLYL